MQEAALRGGRALIADEEETLVEALLRFVTAVLCVLDRDPPL